MKFVMMGITLDLMAAINAKTVANYNVIIVKILSAFHV